MSKIDWQQNIEPTVAAQADGIMYAGMDLPIQDDWRDEQGDTILSIKAGGNGDLYLVDSSGAVFVKFDAADNDQVHAAVRWIATFIKSIES